MSEDELMLELDRLLGMNLPSYAYIVIGCLKGAMLSGMQAEFARYVREFAKQALRAVRAPLN